MHKGHHASSVAGTSTGFSTLPENQIRDPPTAAILGHSATEVTLRYAHLQPGNFTEQERALVDVQLAPSKVLPMAARAG
jgi:hypothetical protein